MPTASELFDTGDLSASIEAALRHVRKHPTDTGSRGFLCELLCFAGQWERADKQLEAIVQQDAEAMVGAGMIRQLIRAENARSQFYREGRVPELVGEVEPLLRRHLEASVCLREGDIPRAAELLAEAEEQRKPVAGTCNGEAFGDWRDLDDLCGPFFEVLTATGKYYWLPCDQVAALEFRPPRQARDLLWRAAHVTFADQRDGEIYLPALYAQSFDTEDDRLKLGRATQWHGGDGAPVRGVGQRMFLVGEEARSVMELERVEFERPTT
jgi:type VI secretion system protein ImpE